MKFFEGWIFLLLALPLALAFGQPDPTVDGRAAPARTDFAVPDAPAFSILGKTPSTIMRPGSSREVAVILSQIFGSTPGLPQSYGIELSPALLVSGNELTLNQYRQYRWLYRTRLSAASTLVGQNHREVALGLRFSLLDNSDLRTDDSLSRELLAFGEQIKKVWEEAVESIRPPPSGEGDEDSLRRERERFVKAKLDSNVDKKIVEARTRAYQRLWNASILELGIAAKAVGEDTTFGRLQAERYASWFTGGLPLGQTGFLLVGGNGCFERGSDNAVDVFAFSTALRAYCGSNDYKGFLEAGGRWANTLLPEYHANLGGEIRVLSGFWADVAVGVSKQGSESASIQASFNVRIATPEEEGTGANKQK